VYMGVIQAQHLVSGARYYEARIVTLNFSLPFNYISISKPMLYCTALLLV
jgi:cobalamin biosynthesis Co2+ chelatase CbiK